MLSEARQGIPAVKNVNAFIIKAKRTSTQNKCSQSYLPGFATASSMKRWLKHGSPIEALGDDKKRRGRGVEDSRIQGVKWPSGKGRGLEGWRVRGVAKNLKGEGVTK